MTLNQRVSFPVIFAILVIGLGAATAARAQTTLVEGDLAFSGYISNDPALFDQFTFVLLKPITPTTVIRFCDFGWRTNIAPGPQFINGGGILESEIVYTNTTGATIPAGREIRYIAGSANATFTDGSNAGAVTVSVGPQFLVGNFNLASTGDQIFAYQGSFASPLFIAGIHMNVEAGTTAGAWDGVILAGSQTNNNSELPTAFNGRSLITGTNANWFATESDNARLNQVAGVPPLGTDVQCRAALNSGNITPANWIQSNVTAGFTLPTGYAYMTPTAANAAISGRVLTANGSGIRNALVTVTGGNLPGPRFATTGTFGYYSFDGLEVGHTYVVTVRSKRFAFPNPDIIVTLKDNVVDANFEAAPD